MITNWELLFLVQLNQKKFQRDGSNVPHIIKSLTYFADADQDHERINITDPEWQEVKDFYLANTRKVADNYLGNPAT